MDCMKEAPLCSCTGGVLAMASFPLQEWCEPYEPEAALCQGTLFPCLNLQFHGTEDIPCSFLKNEVKGKLLEREEAMNEISAVGFAVNDLTLYLDTHPDCEEGIAMMKKLLQKRLEGLADFAARFYPLTQLSIATGKPDSSKYEWDEGPMPWEGGLV